VTPRFERWAARSALVLLVLFSLLLNCRFIDEDKATRGTDFHFLDATFHHYALGAPPHLLPVDKYPPLVYAVTHVVFSRAGGSLPKARLAIVCFVPLFLAAMYGIGRFYGGEAAGLTVAALAAASPHVLNWSREYVLDFPQTAMTALAFWLMLESGGRRSKALAYLAGLAAGLAFLTKWSALVFLAVPLAALFLPHLFRGRRARLAALAGGSVFAATVIALAWIFSHAGRAGQASEWLRPYLLIVVAPQVLLLLALSRLERAEPDDGALRCVTNALRSVAAFFFAAMPWVLYAMNDLRFKFDADSALAPVERLGLASAGTTLPAYLLKVLLTCYPLAPLLMAAGLLLIFAGRRTELLDRLLLPANLVFIFLVSSLAGSPHPRYVLSAVLFAAALGGWWVCRAGRFRYAVAGPLVALSVISAAAWLAFPASPAFTFISRDDGALVSLPFRRAFAALVTGDTPVSKEPGDFAFILDELKHRGVPALRMAVFDRAGLLHRYYPPAAFNEMMVDGALRAGIRFVDVLNGDGQRDRAAAVGLFVFFHEAGDTWARERAFLEAAHPGETPDVITRRSSKGPLVTLVIYPCALSGHGH